MTVAEITDNLGLDHLRQAWSIVVGSNISLYRDVHKLQSENRLEVLRLEMAYMEVLNG